MNPFTASIEQLEATRPDLAAAYVHVGLTRYWVASFGWPAFVWEGTGLSAETYQTELVTVADDLRMISNLIEHYGAPVLIRKFVESPYVPHEEIVFNAPDLGTALSTIITAINNSNPQLSIRQAKDDSWVDLVISVDTALGALRGFMEVMTMVFMLRVLSAYERFGSQQMDEPGAPEVVISHADPLLLATVQELIPARMSCSTKQTFIRFKAGALQQSNPGYWPSKWQKLLVELNEGAKPFDDHEDNLESAITVLLRDWLLYRGRLPQMSEIAAAKGMSVRSLARKLAGNGTSLRTLANEALIKMAFEKLRSTNLPVSQISADLGYSEPSSFVRAFRKVSGTTPGAWRGVVRDVRDHRITH